MSNYGALLSEVVLMSRAEEDESPLKPTKEEIWGYS